MWSSGFTCWALATRAVAARASAAAIAVFFMLRVSSRLMSIMRTGCERRAILADYTQYEEGTMANTRTEKDTFGPIDVPQDRLWGAQTQRSLEHFRISGERMPPEIVRALATIKRACATVNLSLG